MLSLNIADISVFENIQNEAHQSMGFSSLSVFNETNDVAKIHKATNAFIESAQQLPIIVEECLLTWREYIKAVRAAEKRKEKQATEAKEAKQKGDSKPMETYLRQDNAIRDARAMALFEWNRVKNTLKKLEQINEF
jgi:flagellar biosynthesis chaperone FliJ